MAVVHSLEDIEQMPKTKYTSEACNYWIQTNWVYNLKIVHREKKIKSTGRKISQFPWFLKLSTEERNKRYRKENFSVPLSPKPEKHIIRQQRRAERWLIC